MGENTKEALIMNLQKNPAPRSSQELKNGLRSYMRWLQRKTDKIARFFEHGSVRYAKA
ncbi:MAG: hypothetical protein WC749_08520 [Dehalococcoidia bacterium]